MEAISVRDPTDVANARRRIGGLTTQLGYDETNAGRVAIVVTELAQNLVRHGGGGEMLAGADQQREAGIEIMALDRGPGIADVAACLRDGYSTGGTSGNGLGAVQRLAHQILFHSTSQKGATGGTAVLVRMGGNGGPGAMPIPRRFACQRSEKPFAATPPRSSAGRTALLRSCWRTASATARKPPRPPARPPDCSANRPPQPRGDLGHPACRIARDARRCRGGRVDRSCRQAGHLQRHRQHRGLHLRLRRRAPHGVS